MSDRETSVYPLDATIAARRDTALWSPGLRLIQNRGPRVKVLLLLLLSWLAVALLWMLALNWMEVQTLVPFRMDGSRSLHGIVGTAEPWIHRVPVGVLGVALLAVLYLGASAWISLGEPSGRTCQNAHDASESADPRQPAASMGESRVTSEGPRDNTDAEPTLARALSSVHQALLLGHQQLDAAIGETARRTISLCGAFDSCSKHVEVAGADLDAIQDEAAHTQQIMAGLRAHLLTLGGRCQALVSEACLKADSAASAEASRRMAELLEALGEEIVHCHHLSERVGGAGRADVRRIDSIRRCMEGLGHQADRGLREGHQVMGLTRQVQASLAEVTRQLERLAAACGTVDTQVEKPSHQAQAISPSRSQEVA
jgi:hypothetical protein